MLATAEHDNVVAAYGLAWSSDGTLAVLHRSQLSNQRDGSITLVSKNGGHSQIGDGSVWALKGWSPDGRYLVFLTDTQNIKRPYKLWVYDQKRSHLLNFGDDTVFDACWSGKDRITFCTQSPLDATEKLITVSLSGRILGAIDLQTDQHQLLNLALTYNRSADHLVLIAHYRYSQIGSRDYRLRLFLVVNGRLMEVPGTTGCSTLAASPVQPQVAISLADIQTRQITLINSAVPNSGANGIVTGSRLPLDSDVTNLVYSPDGRRILITTLEKRFPNYSDIFLYDIASDTLNFTARGGLGSFSSNGEQVAFVGIVPSKISRQYVNGNRIYTCSTDGTNIKLVDNPPLGESPPHAMGKLLIGLLILVITVALIWIAANYHKRKS